MAELESKPGSDFAPWSVLSTPQYAILPLRFTTFCFVFGLTHTNLFVKRAMPIGKSIVPLRIFRYN